MTSWPRRPTGATLVVASSMPVRDVESFAAAREGVTFHANRGVNGIDGFVSTALGIAAAADDGAPTVALVGDLCFLHDSNGLLGAADRGVDATFVVVDNGGGGIFSFLPAGRPPRALRDAVRHAATGRPRRAGRGARHPRRRGRRRRRARARARMTRSTRAGCGSCGCAPTAPTNVDPPPRGVGRGRRLIARRSFVRPQPPRSERASGSGADERPEHRLELRLGLGPLGVGLGPGDDAGAGHEAGAGAVELGAAQRDGPLAVAAGVDPADRARRSARGRSPRARGWRRARPARGVPPTAGVGCSSRASSSALGRRRVRDAPRIGVARCATGPNTATSGVPATDERRAPGVERLDDRRRRRSGARGCPSPTPPARAVPRRCRRRWCPRPGATRRRRRCAARGARGSRRRSRRWRTRSIRAAARRGRGRCRGRRTACRPRPAPRARAPPSRARRARSRRARARRPTATRRASAARPPRTASAATTARRDVGARRSDLGDPRRTVERADDAGGDHQLAGRIGVERQCTDRERAGAREAERVVGRRSPRARRRRRRRRCGRRHPR